MSDSSIRAGESVVFTANAAGGKGAYTYKWTGAATGTTKSITKKFNAEGAYYAKVKVTDAKGNTATANCGTVQVTKEVIQYNPINVICTVSDRYLQEGDTAVFTASATGGKGTYTYAWSGDVSGTGRSITKQFNSEGTYYATVRVTDSDGRSDTANCASVYVEREIETFDPIDVICTVSDEYLEEGDSATFTARAEGGRGSYTYRWSGDVSGSSRSITERFNDSGIYYAVVRVTDSEGRSANATCDTVRVEEDDEPRNDDFDAVCKVSDTSIEEGDTVRFTAEVDGGDSPYEYEWNGDADSDDRSFTKRFTREGRYEVELLVRDDEGRTARDTCSIIRVDEEDDRDNDDDDDRDINVSSGILSGGSGTFAGVSSVYLNQVPYTGPEDVAKGIAFAVGILVWSIAGALIIRKKMGKRVISSKIQAFKDANKASQI